MKADIHKQTDPLVRVESTGLLCVGKSPLEEWIDRLAEEVATVKVVACFYAPDKPHYHGCLIGVTGDGSTMPFFGCRTQAEVDADLEDRRVRYAGKFVSHASGGRCGGPDQGQGEQPRRAEAVRSSETLADASEGRHRIADIEVCAGRNASLNGRATGADPALSRLEGHRNGAALADGRPRQGLAGPMVGPDGAWWLTEPDVGRVAHGVAARVDRLRALGNGQVPAVVRLAWSLLAPPHALSK